MGSEWALLSLPYSWGTGHRRQLEPKDRVPGQTEAQWARRLGSLDSKAAKTLQASWPVAAAGVPECGKGWGSAQADTRESRLPFVPRRQNLPRKTMPAASQPSCGNLRA